MRAGERNFEVHQIGDHYMAGSEQDLFMDHEKDDQFRDVLLPLFKRYEP